MTTVRVWALLALLLLAAACGRNPVLGAWEVDRDDNERGVLLAVDAAELATLRFDRAVVVAPGVEIPVRYVIEDDLVRVLRDDGRGEHRVELLPDGRIRVDLPIGMTAVYRPS